MKKIVTSLFAVALLMSCSADSDTNVETQDQAIDIAKIEALSTLTPDARFDLTEHGLYRGIFVSADVSLHGEIVVSIKSDSDVSALVMLTTDKNLYFKGKSLGNGDYSFKSDNMFFSINVSNPSDVVITDSNYNNRGLNIRIIKDRSDQRGVAVLGTFEEDGATGFGGTWNYLSWSASSISGDVFGFPVTVPVFNINEVVITYDNGTPGGAMFTDNVMESFLVAGAACATYPLPTTPTAPFFTGPLPAFPVPPLGNFDLNEDFAFDQTSNINGFDANWGFAYSLAAGGGTARAYLNNDCTPSTSGFWTWNGKAGTISFL